MITCFQVWEIQNANKKMKFIIVLLTFLCFQSAYSQTPYDELEKFYNFISKNTNADKMKDSLAMYTCNIKISVDKKMNYKPVVESNDAQVMELISGIEKLNTYDYRKLMGGSKSVIFILPVSIIILDSSYGNKRLDTNINKKISQLFYPPAEEDEHKKIVYLWPLNYLVAKRFYH